MIIQVYPHYRDPAPSTSQPAPAQRAAPDRRRARPAGAAVWLWFIVMLMRDF